MNKKVLTFVFLLVSLFGFRSLADNLPVVVDDEYYLPTNLTDIVILSELMKWPFGAIYLDSSTDDYLPIFENFDNYSLDFWNARDNSVRNILFAGFPFLGTNTMYRLSINKRNDLLPGYHDAVFQEQVLRSQLGIYTNTLNSAYYNASYLLADAASTYNVLWGPSLTGGYTEYFPSDYQSQKDFLSSYYFDKSVADVEKCLLLHNLFVAGNSQYTDSFGLPTSFTNSQFAAAVESSVRKPLDNAFDNWQKHFDVSMQAISTNRIASQALITNKLAQANNKLDALNQAIGNPNDIGNNNTLLGRVVHIDEDLHRIIERLDNQGGAGGGGSGESGNDYADLSRAINSYWNIDWSNTVYNTNTDMLSYRATMYLTPREYADNWEDSYMGTSGDGGSVKMRQVLGLIYTQTLLLDEIRKQQNVAYYADLTNTLFSIDTFLWQNNIPAQGPNPMGRGINALTQKSQVALTQAQSITDSFRTNAFVVQGIVRDFDSIKESVSTAFDNIVKPFQANATKLRLLGASNPGGRPHIRNAEISFNSANQSTYTINLNFANSNDFTDFSETTRAFVRYATNTFLAIYTLLLIHRWSLSIAKRFGG